MSGVRKAEDFTAWQLAEAFKSEVFALLKGSPEAMRDSPFRYQLKDSASGVSKQITEGFYRNSPLDFCRFLGYALGSLREAERWIFDGIESEYFTTGPVPSGLMVREALFHGHTTPETQPGASRGKTQTTESLPEGAKEKG